MVLSDGAIPARIFKSYGGAEVLLHSLLTSAIDESHGPASRPGRFTQRSIQRDAGWAPESVWTFRATQQHFAVAQSLN